MTNALVQKIASNAGDHCAVCGTDRWDLTAGLCARCRDDLGLHPDLQPCPFCGERKNIRLYNRHGMNFISCDGCHARGPELPIEISAYEHWNNRDYEVWLRELLGSEAAIKTRDDRFIHVMTDIINDFSSVFDNFIRASTGALAAERERKRCK